MSQVIIEPQNSGPLSDVLVMLAPYGRASESTTHFVDVLRMQGATLIKTQAKAEVSLTRCVLASCAYDVLRTMPHLNWAFWLDQDVSSNPSSVQDLIRIAQFIRNNGEGIDYPTLSGVYVNRHTTPPRVAAYAIRRMDPLRLVGPVAPQEIECVPALCGMGCLLQHRATFMAHCDESEHFAFPNRNTIVPEVCSSHRIHSSEFGKYIELPEGEDLYYWMSEDFDYCAREFEHGRLVLTCPVMFGHETEHVLWPDGTCVFPGLRPPNDATAKAE